MNALLVFSRIIIGSISLLMREAKDGNLHGWLGGGTAVPKILIIHLQNAHLLYR